VTSVRWPAALLLLVVGCGDDDAAAPAADAGARSCRALFGAAPVYRDCGGDEASCAFHTSGAYNTCGEICDQLGAPCAGSYTTIDGCDRVSGDLGCQHPAGEHICVCLRP